MSHRINSTTRDGDGNLIATTTTRIPKKYRHNHAKGWRGMGDAYVTGVADGHAGAGGLTR